MRKNASKLRIALPLTALLSLLSGDRLSAHCDGMDGPVVKAAQEALLTGKVSRVLLWVRETDEAELTRAFQKAIATRKAGGEARELADLYFFETAVRLHRAGEGAPYTGLKPAGRNLGPAVPAADKALIDGDPEALEKLLREALARGLHERFHKVDSLKNYDRDRPGAGREYVKAYVEYIHFVERIYEATRSSAHGHFPEGEGHHEHR